MRILVCGGRNYWDQAAVDEVLDEYRSDITVVIEGGATGADACAREWARKNRVQTLTFPADWARFGKSAGPYRNLQMLDEGKPDLVVAFPGGRGTENMVSLATQRKVNIRRYEEK